MTEILPTPSAKDLNLLRSSRRTRISRSIVTIVLGLVACLFISLFATYLLRLRFGEPASPLAQRAQLVQLQQGWSSNFADQLRTTTEWFQSHGTATEAALFDGLSGVVIDSLLGSNSATVPEDELSSFGRTFIAIHLGLVRLLFFVIASFRLCLAVGLFAFVRGMGAWRPYEKSDALGQMGNGRVFYSGAYAALEAVTAEGLPNKLTRGFACPQTCSIQEVKASPLWRSLSSLNVATQTNTTLAQILLKNRATAPYVALMGEEELLVQSFKQSDLAVHATALLGEVLRVHSECTSGVVSDPQALSDAHTISNPETPYAERVALVLRRVLTPHLRAALAEVPPTEIATFVLAFESGKVLAHSYEGERWVRRSNFVHLSARAVLHSLVEYPLEFSPDARTRIRIALVYAARKSPFSPIRLPVDLDTATVALRQWAEVLLACPHELADVAAELEAFAIVREAQNEWRERFSDTANESLSTLRSCGYATRTNLLFLPLGPLVADLRSTIPPQSLERLRVLLHSLATAQARMEGENDDEEGGVAPTLSFDRVHHFLPAERVSSLALMHGIHPSDLSDWLVLRYILSNFGWLASRVGDYSVPKTGVVFSVFQASLPLPGTNPLGRLGVPGMVALRGNKVREALGSSWRGYFTEADRVTIAETDKEYERLLQGFEDRPDLDEAEQGMASTAEPQR